MLPAYKNANDPTDAPLDILFLNLSNWPGNPVYPYAFVQVSALARRAGLTIRRWDGLGLNRAQQLACITDLLRQHRPAPSPLPCARPTRPSPMTTSAPRR